MVFNGKEIGEIFEKIENLVINLYDRWFDECRYEDIDVYKGIILKKLNDIHPGGFNEITMFDDERGFGFEFITDYVFKNETEPKKAIVKIFIDSSDNCYTWNAYAVR